MSHRYCGREFSAEDLAQIRRLIAEQPSRTRAELSRLTCQALNWYKADGGLKQMSCRVAMLRMHAEGLIQLPPPTCQRPQVRIQFTPATAAQPVQNQPVHDLPPLQLHPVKGLQESRLWNEFIHRYHYLGYKALPGAQLRYFVSAAQQPLALLGFGASAWQCAPRDRYIGWTHQQRQNNLHLIINHARFLILPWVRSKNLASKILALAARKLPEDWLQQYHYRPVLMETFVQKSRFAGTCYKAANWHYLGETKGRGKLGPAGKRTVPIKDIWVYPFNSSFKRILTN